MVVCNACYGQNGRRLDSLQKVMQDSGWATMSSGLPLTTSIHDTSTLLKYGKEWKVPDVPIYQRKQDTVKVICQISDTARQFYIQWRLDLSHAKIDTTKVWGGVSGAYEVPDTIYTDYIKSIYWQELYIVRELHNTSEGVIDPLICQGCNWHDYYQNLYYLDKDKKKLSPNIVVWQSIEVK